ncbi:phage tail protein [Paenibacillus tepidiphilus]|uniref:phage tail protein n=1 Tax=Paenibacillus tepidiphilus TaxID=2608683 RepID=UPI00123B16CA|nr:phage tail protein [Paenibacillus tepidiphilus]
MTTQDDYSYVSYLPRIFQQQANQSEADFFLGRFLKGFEALLSGKTGALSGESVGIEALLDGFHHYFDPLKTPASFLPWLAGWLGLTLTEGEEYDGNLDTYERTLTPAQLLPLTAERSTVNRKLLGGMMELYKKRGTPEGLAEYLQVFAGEEAAIHIESYEEPVRCGKGSRIGINTMTGPAEPSYFTVHIILPAHSRSLLQNKVNILQEVLRREKPFYTNYSLNIEVPRMRLGVYGRVGMETLVGGMREE